jgi:hypothetical protein
MHTENIYIENITWNFNAKDARANSTPEQSSMPMLKPLLRASLGHVN